jgi:hypothetical protein
MCQDSPWEFLYVLSSCSKLLDEVVASQSWLGFGATGEYIDRGVSQLGPRMDADVAFGEDDDACDTLWDKGVKKRFYDGCLGDASGFEHRRLDGFYVVETGFITFVTF